MKKLLLLVATFVVILTLSACEDVCVGPECYGGGSGGSEEYADGIGVAIPFKHINGEGHETDKNAIILMENSDIDGYVIYQVTYLSCTCRPGVYNFWNTVYVQINTGDKEDIRLISWHHDFYADGSEGHYLAATWGDSSGADEQGGVTLEDLEEVYFPWYIGKTFEDLDGMSVVTNTEMHGISNTGSATFTDEIVDGFSSSTVSTNNFLRVMVELLRYHSEKY